MRDKIQKVFNDFDLAAHIHIPEGGKEAEKEYMDQLVAALESVFSECCIGERVKLSEAYALLTEVTGEECQSDETFFDTFIRTMNVLRLKLEGGGDD